MHGISALKSQSSPNVARAPNVRGAVEIKLNPGQKLQSI